MLSKNKITIFFIILIAIDLLMVLFHILYGQNYDLFNLGKEQNLPTYYQSFKTLLVAAIFFSLWVISRAKTTFKKHYHNLSFFWLVFTILFSYLCIDEAGQIHERLFSQLGLFFPKFVETVSALVLKINYQSNIWLLLYFPIVVFVILTCLYFVIKAWKYYGKKIYLFILSLTFLVMVLITECLNMKVDIINTSSYQYMMIAEELFEMIGVSIMVLFGLKILFDEINSKKIKSNI